MVNECLSNLQFADDVIIIFSQIIDRPVYDRRTKQGKSINRAKDE